MGAGFDRLHQDPRSQATLGMVSTWMGDLQSPSFYLLLCPLVTHPSANHSQRCLTSLIRLQVVLPISYGSKLHPKHITLHPQNMYPFSTKRMDWDIGESVRESVRESGECPSTDLHPFHIQMSLQRTRNQDVFGHEIDVIYPVGMLSRVPQFA